MKKYLLLLVFISALVMNVSYAQSAENDEIIRQYGDIFSITTQQRVEDYQYLWDTLEDSYLYWGVMERQGIDADRIYNSFLANKEMYAEIPNRSHWYEVLDNDTSRKNYPAFGEMIRALEGENIFEGDEDGASGNITAFIIPGEEIAYIRIKKLYSTLVSIV